MDFSSVIINNTYQSIYIPIADSVLYNIRYKADKIRTYNKRRSLSEKLGTIRLRYAANQAQSLQQDEQNEKGPRAWQPVQKEPVAIRSSEEGTRSWQQIRKESVAIRNKKSNRSTTYKQQY